MPRSSGNSNPIRQVPALAVDVQIRPFVFDGFQVVAMRPASYVSSSLDPTFSSFLLITRLHSFRLTLVSPDVPLVLLTCG